MSPKLVLIVDDDRDQRVILAGVLEHAGYHTEGAENGHHAVQLASLRHPDLIIMDFQMPFMDGLTATEILRSLRGLDHVPVIGMTAYDYDADTVQQVGFDDFFVKPIAPNQLLDSVGRLLGGERNRAPTT